MAHFNRRSALGLLAAGSSGAIAAARPAIAAPAASALLTEPDAMATMVAARRRYLAAYAVAPFDDCEGEMAWTNANDPDPDNVLGQSPPPITSDAGLRAAIEYVAVLDKDFAQEDHVRILTRALEYLDCRGM